MKEKCVSYYSPVKLLEQPNISHWLLYISLKLVNESLVYV